MRILEFFDRVGERRLERWRIQPPRPRNTRMIVGTLFFAGYYFVVYSLLRYDVPGTNEPLVRDALLVLGPVIGAIGQALFRTDTKDEMATQNTGEAFRAQRTQAEATIAAAAATPPGAEAGTAAGQVADAAQEEADRIQGD